MHISKILQIQSKFHLYDVLEKNPTLMEQNSEFLPLYDYLYAYYNGCRCLEEQYLADSDIEYAKLMKSEKVTNTLTSYFSCDSIVFK